jgi:hypothetical protein
MLTIELAPSNESALPNLPELVQAADVIVPTLLFPEASATVLPEPSSKP